jgi:hypothetical protein
MNALASYLRHLIVTGILFAVEKLGLPVEGADAAADVIALAVVGTLSWWVVKYVAPKVKGKHLPLILLTGIWVGLAVMGMTSCSVSLGPDGKPQWTVDPDAVARAIADRINEIDGGVIVDEK